VTPKPLDAAPAQQLSREILARQATLQRLAGREHPFCLLCGADNPLGLRLRFEVQADGSIAAGFFGAATLQSYPATLHGGVTSALIDAAMVNVLFSVGVVAVTAELTVRFLRPVRLDRSARVSASIDPGSGAPLFHVSARLEQDGQLMARATAKFISRGEP
jgi:uncharacterized protein (TIGR00369 family)